MPRPSFARPSHPFSTARLHDRSIEPNTRSTRPPARHHPAGGSSTQWPGRRPSSRPPARPPTCMHARPTALLHSSRRDRATKRPFAPSTRSPAPTDPLARTPLARSPARLATPLRVRPPARSPAPPSPPAVPPLCSPERRLSRGRALETWRLARHQRAGCLV